MSSSSSRGGRTAGGTRSEPTVGPSGLAPSKTHLVGRPPPSGEGTARQSEVNSWRKKQFDVSAAPALTASWRAPAARAAVLTRGGVVRIGGLGFYTVLGRRPAGREAFS